MTQVKRRKGWRMNCDVGEVTERLENELCFTYVTDHSPTLPLLNLRHSSFSNPSFASPTSQALHLRHLASHPCCFTSSFLPPDFKRTFMNSNGKNVHLNALPFKFINFVFVQCRFQISNLWFGSTEC